MLLRSIEQLILDEVCQTLNLIWSKKLHVGHGRKSRSSPIPVLDGMSEEWHQSG